MTKYYEFTKKLYIQGMLVNVIIENSFIDSSVESFYKHSGKTRMTQNIKFTWDDLSNDGVKEIFEEYGVKFFETDDGITYRIEFNNNIVERESTPRISAYLEKVLIDKTDELTLEKLFNMKNVDGVIKFISERIGGKE